MAAAGYLAKLETTRHRARDLAAGCTRTRARRSTTHAAGYGMEVVEVPLDDERRHRPRGARRRGGRRHRGGVRPAAELPRHRRGPRARWPRPAKRTGALVVCAADPLTLGDPAAAGRARRGRVRGRGPDARQPARLRRPVVRLLRGRRALHPPDARPDRRRDRATWTAGAASCSRSRRASSTSGARRPRTTSAPRRR